VYGDVLSHGGTVAAIVWRVCQINVEGGFRISMKSDTVRALGVCPTERKALVWCKCLLLFVRNLLRCQKSSELYQSHRGVCAVPYNLQSLYTVCLRSWKSLSCRIIARNSDQVGIRNLNDCHISVCHWGCKTEAEPRLPVVLDKEFYVGISAISTAEIEELPLQEDLIRNQSLFWNQWFQIIFNTLSIYKELTWLTNSVLDALIV
jgi:hypothetical protein